MKTILVSLALAGCTGLAGAQTPAPSTAKPRPTWQEQMKEARALAANGMEYVLVGPTDVFVFYNQPQPFCYTYKIPGEWVSVGGNTYKSKDGRATVVVQFGLPQHVAGLKGTTLLERAQAFVTKDYQKALGKKIKGVTLVPFESARPGTWRWTAESLKPSADTRIDFPTKLIIDLSPAGFVLITASASGATAQSDAVAAGICESLSTTSEPDCYWPVLEKMLKEFVGDDAS